MSKSNAARANVSLFQMKLIDNVNYSNYSALYFYIIKPINILNRRVA